MPLYHVWFACKRRRWLLQGEVAERAKDVLRTVAGEKQIKLIECETMVDHVHMLLDLRDNAELSRAMNLLKGISSRRLSQEFPEVSGEAGDGHFWQRRGSKLIPPTARESVDTYIRTQWDRPEKYER
ncbi:MAG TPA: IS200/IS605 family transposase [Dehalococcoidia bacterium]|nr:IS200/IS605 family transposase [Dehalococcoidia bacterium]